ncbi:MAG: PAS domain S-box protein [Desulfamplus sp.]|nr:PAS domain S-box protein [Desulfamplus sp.]
MDKINTTQHRLQQHQIKEHETQYRELIEALNVGVFRTTPEGLVFLQANKATANIFGYDSIEEFMQTSMYDHYKYPNRMQKWLERLRVSGEWKNFEIDMQKKDGTQIWVSFNVTVKYDECNANDSDCYEDYDDNNAPYNINIFGSEEKEFLQAKSTKDKEQQDNLDKTVHDKEHQGRIRIIKWIDGVVEDITERKEALNKLKRLNEAYERFVPQEFLKTLGKKSIEEVQLNDRIQKKMTILFSDIRNFSTLSEAMSPEENFKFINSYLSYMGPFVRKHHGFIDKFIGDSIMAIFGRDSDDAILAAIDMLRELRGYNEGRKRAGYPMLQIGIGINTGILMLGIVGEANRMEGTVISDAVNTASRLEQLTKKYNTPLLISEHTFHSLKKTADFAIRFVDRVIVKGRSEPIAIYEVFNADPPQLFESKLSHKSLFETALYHLRYHDIEHAKSIFDVLLKKAPDDPLAKRYQSFTENDYDHFFSPWNKKKEFEIKEELMCDIPIIDDAHIEMFRLTYLLMEIIKQNLNNETITELLIELNNISKEHFETEKEMMEQADYPEPELDLHMMLHKEFLSNSQYVLHMASQTNYTKKSEALHLLLRIETLFVEWLVNHEITADKHFIAFMMGFR